MQRLTVGALSLAIAALTALPAQAQSTCNYMDIANAQDSMKNMVDASQKEAVMREVAMARQSMASGDRSGCAAHMQALDQLSRQK